MSVKKEQNDKKKYRDNPSAIAEYLTEIFEKNDVERILHAIKIVMKAQNVKALSESIGLRREGLYKSFGGARTPRDPTLGRLLKLFEGLGVQIIIKPRPAPKKSPRPKIGRSPVRERSS